MVLDDGFSEDFRSLLSRIKTQDAEEETTTRDSWNQRTMHPMVSVSLTLANREPKPNFPHPRHDHSYSFRAKWERPAKGDNLLQAIVPITRVQRKNEIRNHRREMVLKIDTVSVEDEEFTVGPTGIKVLGELVECGICAQNVPMITRPSSRPPATGASYAYIYGKRNREAKERAIGMRSLIAVHGSSPTSSHCGVRTVTISKSTSDGYPTELLSAVQHSQTVRHVIVTGMTDERYLEGRLTFWRWVAFALLSPYATHNVTTLELRLTGMRMSDVTAVHEMLSVLNPFALVSSHCDPDIPPRRIKASEFYLGEAIEKDVEEEEDEEEDNDMDEHHEAEEGPFPLPVLFRSETELDVLLMNVESHDGKPLRVQLPGSKKAWDSSELLRLKKTEDAAQDRSQEKNRKFPKVVVQGMPRESMRAIVALFRFIGRGIKRLEIHGAAYDEVEKGEWIRQLLIECPDLEELKILSSDIRPFYSSYKSGLCRVKRMTIQGAQENIDDRQVMWQNRERNLWEFFGALADRRHPTVLHIQDLDLDLSFRNDLETLSRVEDLIKKNRHLRSLRLHARISPDMRESVPQDLAKVFPGGLEGGESTRVQVYELGRRKKLAFLCVINQATP